MPGSTARRAGPRRAVALVLVVVLVASVACSGSDDAAPGTSGDDAPTVEELTNQGGEATVAIAGREAFGQPLPGLTGAQRRTFAVGNSFFNQNWVTAPASTEGRDGLGPLFNAQACSSCHFKDGRGRPPEDADDAERGLLVRLSVAGDDGETLPHPRYGSQFQDRAIRDVAPEGSVEITTTERVGQYPDGEPWSLAVPAYRLNDHDGKPIENVMISPRVAPIMVGMGLLEGIPTDDIAAAEDPDDRDDDGISGRVHWVTDPETGERVLGRLGWKAAVPSTKVQTADAFVNDIGITSSLRPDQPCTPSQNGCAEAPDGGDPELEDRKLDQVTFYSRTLAVPARRDVDEPDVSAGREAFVEVGCASCHTPESTTGPSDLRPLDRQVIRPYTDLLLHDMGPDLADDRPDGDASGREWRTPPLWGIGLVETVNRHTRFLHDGRARNLEEAVLWHGGEAQRARDAFGDLSSDERRQVLDFLESL